MPERFELGADVTRGDASALSDLSIRIGTAGPIRIPLAVLEQLLVAGDIATLDDCAVDLPPLQDRIEVGVEPFPVPAR